MSLRLLCPFIIRKSPPSGSLFKMGGKARQKFSTRKFYSQLIQNRFLEKRKILLVILQLIQFISTTDCWTKAGRSYLGVTAHWLTKAEYNSIEPMKFCFFYFLLLFPKICSESAWSSLFLERITGLDGTHI